MERLRKLAPVNSRSQKCIVGLGIRSVLRLPAKNCKFRATAFAHRIGEMRLLMVRKEEKWRGSTPLLALEQHRNERRCHDQRCADLQPARTHQLAAAIPSRA